MTHPVVGTAEFKEWAEDAMRKWPFVTRAIDPIAVFPAPEDRRPLSYIIEKQERTAGEIKLDYPEWVDTDSKNNPARRVEWLEYWDSDEYIVEVEGQNVIHKDNPYGFVPYIYEYSGMGRRHHSNDPAHLAIGVLTNIMGELEEEVRLKTAISVQTQMHVFPPILTTDDPQTVAEQFGVGPGKGHQTCNLIPHPCIWSTHRLMRICIISWERFTTILRGFSRVLSLVGAIPGSVLAFSRPNLSDNPLKLYHLSYLYWTPSDHRL